jgi:predicted TIM-barrel enzyme
MAITEEARHHLYQALEQALGSDEAATLMEHLPPVGWADVATKRDLDALGAAIQRDIEMLAAATKQDIEMLAAATKQDIEMLAAATKQGIEMLAAANKQDIEMLAAATEHGLGSLELRLGTRISDLRADVYKELRTQMMALVGTNLTVGALVVAAIRLL